MIGMIGMIGMIREIGEININAKNIYLSFLRCPLAIGLSYYHELICPWLLLFLGLWLGLGLGVGMGGWMGYFLDVYWL